MTVISVINPKGGVGKTTISLNLGLFLASLSKNVSFIDLDPQNSLSDWLKRRPASLSQYNCLKRDCEKLCKQDLIEPGEDSIVIVDCPAGMNTRSIENLLKLSDILLIPINPSPVDLSALARFFFQLAAIEDFDINNKAIGLIANRSKVYTRAHVRSISKINNFNIPLITVLRDTQNYSLTASKGMGLVDLPKYYIKSDAGSWESILSWVEKGDSD